MPSLIERYLDPSAIELNVDASDMTRAFALLVSKLAQLAKLSADQERRLLATVIDRESKGSTALGRGVAMPHGKYPALKHYFIVAGRTAHEPPPYRDADGRPVDLFFLLAGPPSDNGTHLQVMARLMRMCRDESLRRRLMEAPTAEEFRALLIEAEHEAEQQS